MKSSIWKRALSCFLAVLMLVLMLPITAIAADGDETTTPKVEIVSFLRGSQTDLRSSELLEARVTGYDGNVQELTYEWTNELGTYLYVYNSHNMYNIENTNGEIEIYNNNVGTSANMSGRSYKDTFSGTGFCWAAVYGADVTNNYALDGTITVTVKDKDGNVIGTDSHTGDVTTTGILFWTTYDYSGFIPYSLGDDMQNVNIGIFEGETQNVKNLLGESAVVHITCTASTVNSGTITSGSDCITLTQDSSGNYYITGTKAGKSTDASGDAQISLSISKGNCKFHYESSGTATTTVFVFKKPTTSTTTTTLTLTGNLDDRCSYFINGTEGTKQDDGTIIFTGLTPNTEYTVEVRGEYKDTDGNTQYAYAYVKDTTLPVYTGTVKVYLDGTYDTSTATATGTLVDIEDMIDNDGKLYVKEVNGTEFIELNHTDTGIYNSVVENGTYYLYYDDNEDSRIDEQVLVMNNANRTRYVFFNSVTYKDGNTVLGDVEHYLASSSVNVRSEVPTKDGHIFTGWKDENGNTYQPSAILTSQIGEPYVLTAQWAEAVDVYVNVTLNHTAENGAVNNDSSKHNITYELMQKDPNTSGDYTDIAQKTIEWNGSTSDSVDGYTCSYTDNVTTYTATAPAFTNVLADMEYTLAIAKSGYSIVSIDSTTDENGDVVINAELIYNPNDFDFTFDVELDEEAKALPDEFKPVAVNVKVTSWYSPEGNTAGWYPIAQHQNTYVKVDIDDTGKGSGTYPVWTTVDDDGDTLYSYRIEVVSYVLPDGTIMPATDVDNNHTNYITSDERYKANIVVTDGRDPVADDTSTLTGAWYEDNAQQGSVKAVISILTHKVTFEPNGGEFSDGTTENKIVDKQIVVPDLTQYTPTKDGGYVFAGWYLVNENGEITDTTVNSGDDLYNDITLRAKWNAPLTVEGQVTISGTYKIDGITHTIHDVDRTKSAVVLLQKILPNGYSESIQTKTVEVTYADDTTIGVAGKGSYEFTQVPDDGSEYRILVLASNYSALYQNEPESLTSSDNYTLYDISQYMAEFGETDSATATVNAFLHFYPEEFALKYHIDSTAIGEGFRPTSAETLVLYDDGLNGINPQDWAVISQMVQNGAYYGQNTALTNGTGSNSYPVWKAKPDGQTTYDYAVLLNTYTTNGTETVFDETTAPFKALYNGSTCYDPLTGEQTKLLTIKLQPKLFAVNLAINFTQTMDDYVTNMENYNLATGYATVHKWSYDTDISNIKPERAGYKFLGWYDNADGTGEPVTTIEASVAENVTLYAKWEEGYTVTFHNNNAEIDEDIFRTYYESDVTIPEGDSNMALNEDNTITSFYDIPEFDYTTHNKYIFKGWYLDAENNNDSRPISWNTIYTENTDVYAHWINVGTVEKDVNDTKKLIADNGFYPEYDLIGVQIRDVVEDNIEHYGESNTGLRFITVLSENVYSQINTLSTNNSNGAEYGYVMAKTDTAQSYAQASGSDDYELQYKGSNVNGVDTSTAYKYVQNIKCSGVPDHFNGESYRLYTAVVTYKNLSGDALDNAHQTKLVARSYIRYYDANGLYRTYYNNYTGTNTYSGCSTSFSDIQAMANVSN